MLPLILTLCLFDFRPRQAPLPPQAPPAAAKCRCGDGCPLGGNCAACSCATPSRPARPDGDGWRYDDAGGYWWRPVTPTHDHRGAIPLHSMALPDYRPFTPAFTPAAPAIRYAPPAPAYRPAPLSYSMPRTAASCST